MHGRIQKFTKKLNGTFKWNLHFHITLMPWGLTAVGGSLNADKLVQGSLNADKLVQHLIQTISKVKLPNISAYSEAPNPQHFFKLG